MDNSLLVPNIINAIAVLGAAAIAAASAIIIERKAQRDKKLNKYKNIKDRIDVDYDIHGMLGVLLEKTHADRSYIYQFHPDNNPIYFSCSYEEVRAGVSSEIDNRQNLLLSQHPFFMKSLSDTHNVCCNVNTMCKEKIGRLYKSEGVEVTCMHPIRNDAGYMMGLVGLDYLSITTSIEGDISSILSDFSFTINSKLKGYEK